MLPGVAGTPGSKKTAETATRKEILYKFRVVGVYQMKR
jgi:hypothetical protein